MEFKDFKENPGDLVGCQVLKSDRYGLYIRTIVAVTKTGFKLSNDTGLYNIKTGDLKGESDWSRTSCSLLTDDEAKKYKQEWAIKAEIKLLKKKITDSVDGLTFAQLKSISEIIDNK